MPALLLLAILPRLFSDRDPQSVDASAKLDKPGVQYRMDRAAATSVPWIDANGWRMERDPKRTYYYDVPADTVPLAMAEAYAHNVQAVIRGDRAVFGRMLAFLQRIDQPAMPPLVNIGLIDDGSDIAGEAMNLLTRRNLLFRVVKAPDAKLDLNIKPGAKDASDPFAYALDVRQKLGDDKRLVRLYGSDVVLANLTGEAGKARLFLINYSNRKVTGLRVRVRGAYAKATLQVFGIDNAVPADIERAEGAIELTVPEMGPFAVVNLVSHP